MSKESVTTEVTYYREHGLHQTPATDTPTYIASALDWEDMHEILKHDMPYSGDVVTNDYATTSGDFTTIPDQMNDIAERIRAVRALTMHTEATVHLGTPAVGPRGQIHLAALSIHRGQIVGSTYKDSLYPVEEAVGMTVPNKPNHLRVGGTALMICSDLIWGAGNMTEHERFATKRVFGLTAWAYSAQGEKESADDYAKRLKLWHDNAGGEDNYHRNSVEFVVEKRVLDRLPNARSVVIADEGRADLAPYNAYFKRVS